MAKNNPVNHYVQYASTLGIFCLAASGLLSVVHNFTRPKIFYQQTLQEQAGLKEVFAQADDFEPVRENGEIFYYKALGRSRQVLGFAFKAVQRGYAGDIVTMVGLDRGGVITNIKIFSQHETPGLGSKIAEVIQKETAWSALLKKLKLEKAGFIRPPQPWFQAQFRGKRVTHLDSKKAEECAKKLKRREVDETCSEGVVAITGATISSRAVIESIRAKARQVMEKAGHE